VDKIKPLIFSIGNINTLVKFGSVTNKFYEEIAERYKPFVGKSVSGHVKYYCQLVVDIDNKIKFRYNNALTLDSRQDFFIEPFRNFSKMHAVLRRENVYSFDSLLRVVYTLLLTDFDGFMLHSSGLIAEDRSYLFVGRSGAGKSTILRLLTKSTQVSPLSDELVIVRKDSAYNAYSTPFWGELSPGNAANKSAKIDKTFFLVKSEIDKISRISRSESIKLLLPNVLFFSNNPSYVNRLIETVAKFCNTVGFRKLWFSKSIDINTLKGFSNEN
jgi:hypothetical protein